MKKICLWFDRNRMITGILILFIFLFYLSYSLYQKCDLTIFEKVIKDNLVNIASMITPKVSVDYTEVDKVLSGLEKQELEDLRQLLDLTNNSSYLLEHASVIERNASYYFDEITINKGKNNGLDQGMLAITEKGVLGIVKYVTKNTSTIKLLTEENSSFKIAVAVYYKDNCYNGILTGYDINTKELLVTSIGEQSDIEIGSVVKTNGLGNLYPKGITIGNVSSISYDDTGLSKILRIKSEVDFLNIKYASIIKGVKV